MSSNNDILFALVRLGLHESIAEEDHADNDLSARDARDLDIVSDISPDAWQEVYALAVKQGVSAVAWDGLERAAQIEQLNSKQQSLQKPHSIIG